MKPTMKGTTNLLAPAFLLGLLAGCASDPGQGEPPATLPPREPALFGSHALAYQGSPLRPTGAAATLDQVVRGFYDQWKSRYLVSGCGGQYVRTQGGTGSDQAITISEAHGYGMMLLAIMAGHDPKARETFDDFVRVSRKVPSDISSSLMSWAIGSTCTPIDGANSATDGDLDMAFALLLAHRQWGSDGDINYGSEGGQLIAAIARNDFNRQTSLPLLGDWATSPGYVYSTRPSDFMLDHFRAFAPVTNKDLFDSAIERSYQIIEQVQQGTGLVPDFVVETDKQQARPAMPGFLEGQHDGDYSYNACRAPWRLGTDLVVSGDERAKRTMGTVTKWLKGKANGKPEQIAAGYSLDGNRVLEQDDNGAFIGPFAVAAMASGDSANQQWLDDLWKWMAETPPQDYYADSIRLLSMIVVSGNWITP
jgi:endo-1,4-beta-D-glucanase Y